MAGSSLSHIMITFDQFITAFSAFGLLVLGLLTLWFVCATLSRREWWRCPRCGRWQDTLGEYGMPVDGDRDGGDNCCELCQRTQPTS